MLYGFQEWQKWFNSKKIINWIVTNVKIKQKNFLWKDIVQIEVNTWCGMA